MAIAKSMTVLPGSEKVKCAVRGCKFEGHALVKHVKEEHEMSVSEYMEKYPDSRVASAAVVRRLRDTSDRHEPPEREIEEVDAIKLFKLPKSLSPNDDGTLTVYKYSEPTEYTPSVDSRYVFPPEQTKMLLMGLTLTERNRVWIGGYSGTGKTELVLNACAKLGHEVFIISADDAQSRRHLIGEWVTLPGGAMKFQYGVLPIAMMRGATLLIDEADSWNPKTFNIIRMLLTDRPQLIILENGGEVIKPAEGFRVIGTGNTFGGGDDSGLFPTTNTLSVADRQRFSIFIKLDFLDEETEKKIIKQAFEEATEMDMERFLRVAHKIREQQAAGVFEESFSVRQLLNWIEKFYLLGDAQEAARVTFTNALAPPMAVAISEIIKAAFESP